MKTFKEFMAEAVLSERVEAQGSRGRALSPRGPNKHRGIQRSIQRTTSDRAALKKAGFKRLPKDEFNTGFKSHETWNSDEHSTKVNTNKNQTTFARGQSDLYNPKTYTPKPGHQKVRSSGERVRHLKALRKQLGGTRTERPVHMVDISADEHHNKNDPSRLVSRGKSFKQELQSTPKALKSAGAKTGDIVVGKPTATMGNENPETGRKKRARLYQRTFGSKLNPRTSLMIGRARL
jgi:hypothetical protein